MGCCSVAVCLLKLFCEVLDYVCGFSGAEETDDGSVSEEAEVSVVSYNMHGTVPGYLVWRCLAWSDVVDCADVATIEADPGSETEHQVP